jgi:hypothetical protein
MQCEKNQKMDGGVGDRRRADFTPIVAVTPVSQVICPAGSLLIELSSPNYKNIFLPA